VTDTVFETVLENGLKVLIQEVRTAPVAAFMVWYRVGSRNEAVGTTGISHLLEHMMFKGTPTFGKGEIARTLQRIGASFNAATSMDYTNYHEVLSSRHLPLAVRLEADRMVNALIPEEEHRLEMTVVRSELERNDDEPHHQLYQETCANAFQAHPYHWPTIGWRSDVERITTEEIRAYYRAHYMPNNATVVLVGDVGVTDGLALVREHFGPIPAGTLPAPVRTEEPEQRGERRFKIRRPGDTAYLMISWKTPVLTHPDSYALDALGLILGHGRTSRLYQALVEGKLATEADASNETLRDPFLLVAQATAAPGVPLPALEESLLRAADDLRRTPPSADELQRARKQLQAMFVYAKDSIRSLALQLGYFETVAGWRYLETYLDHVDRLTPEDIRRVAETHLHEDRRVVGWYEPSPVGAEAAPEAERMEPEGALAPEETRGDRS
jgi:zinc protease